jgi:DNA-binding NarL/FixJ family response regulator
VNRTARRVTRRQWEVLAQAARGHTFREIAATLHVSTDTVNSHVRNAGRHLGAGRLPQLMDCAYQQGLFATLPAEDRRYRKLSPRRQQTLEGLARGLTDKQIGEELFVSEDTVSTHVRLLYQDLGARNRWHAVALGHQLGHLATIPTIQEH